MDMKDMQNRLIKNRLLKTAEEISDFEDTIAMILEMNDINHIEVLCLGFDDLTEQHEVMFGLIHAIEHYYMIGNPEVYLRKFAQSVRRMLPHAEEWSEILHYRILNNERSRTMYKKIVGELDRETLDIIVSQLTKIKNDDPEQFETSVNYVLQPEVNT